MDRDTITVHERPVCNEHGADGRRCRKTAVASYDGVWCCAGHEEGKQRLGRRLAIVWIRSR